MNRFPATLVLLSLAAALGRAEEPRLPDRIVRFREALANWKGAKEGRERGNPESEFVTALLRLREEDDPRVADCYLDAADAPEAVSGHHGEWSSHSMAISALTQRHDDLAALIGKARARGSGARALVAHVIRSRRDPAGLDFLVESLAPGPETAPFTVVDAIAAIPGEKATEALLSVLTDTREAILREYPIVFQRWDRLPKAVPYKFSVVHPLWVVLRPDCIQISNITEIRESSPVMRMFVGVKALRHLEARGDEVPLQSLRAMLGGHVRLQLAAARYIGDHFPAEIGACLAKDWESPYVRGQCAEFLARSGDATAAKSLVEMSRSDDLVLRVWAIQALAETPDAGARERLAEAALDAEPFVAHAAIAAMRAGGIPVPRNAVVAALLSWDYYLCREGEVAARRLDAATRALVAHAVLAGETPAIPDGPRPDDRVTAGGEAEPAWEGEEFRGSSMTVSNPGSVESATERIRRFQTLAEGLDAAPLRDRGRAVLVSLPYGPEVPAPEDEEWNEPRRALATAAIALAPNPEDLGLLLRWTESLHPPIRLAAIRGLGTLGGTDAEAAILRLHEETGKERIGWGRNPLYAATVAALAECGTGAAREKFLTLAPWTLYPKPPRLSTYEEVENVSSFVEGMVRARFEGHDEVLRRTRDWLGENASSSFIQYEIGPRFWTGLLRRRPKAASVLALEVLETGSQEAAGAVLTAEAPLDAVLVAAISERIVRENWTSALWKLHSHDAGAALLIARDRLSKPLALDRDPGSTTLDFLLKFGDASDLPLLDSLAPGLSTRHALALLRFQARFTTK
ncbi:MAG: HEAT repeat domain-containing protein [Planctomycetes bacterium]|nr:HEAT repeat domain-containing protein [Planctomycetota bacterium]